MKSILLLAAVTLLTTSCVSLDGTLVVSEKMSVKKKGGFLNLGRKNVDIEANQYDAHLTVLGKNNYALILNKGEDRISIPLKSEKDLNLPQYDGEIRIAGSDIGQPFDVRGRIDTDISSSPTQEAIESCTWDTRETRCHIECQDQVTKDDHGVEHKENKCQKLCEDYTVTHQGRHEVIFHYTTTHRDLSLELLKEGTSAGVAHFNGSSTETSKIIERQGICN